MSFGSFMSAAGSLGGGGVSGGSDPMATTSSSGLNQGDVGNIHNEGLTINAGGFKFDEGNPVHIGGAILIAAMVFGGFLKMLRR